MGAMAQGMNDRIRELLSKNARTSTEEQELQTLTQQFKTLGIPQNPGGDFDLAAVEIVERVTVKKFDGEYDESKKPIETITFEDKSGGRNG